MSNWIQNQFVKKLSPQKLFLELFKNVASTEESKAYLQIIASKVTVAFPIEHTSKSASAEHEETMTSKAPSETTCICFCLQTSAERSYTILVGPPESGKKTYPAPFWIDFGFVKFQDLNLFGTNNYSTWELDEYKFESISDENLLKQLLELPCSPIELDEYQHVVCDEKHKEFYCVTSMLCDEYSDAQAKKKGREEWQLSKIEPRDLGDIFIRAAYAKLFRLSSRKALAKAPRLKTFKPDSKRSIQLKSSKLGRIDPSIPLSIPLDTKELDLSMNELKQVPEWIKDLKQLESLCLYANKITELPEWISELSALKKLELTSNSIKKLPESIGLLKNLNIFNCLGNQLSSLPKSLFQLPKLKQLHANNNKIKKLPDTAGQATALQYVNLSKNLLDKLPKGFALLSKLEHLDLSSNPIDFPKEISNFKNLRSLVLENAQVTAVPDQFQAAHLSKLWLSQNQITQFLHLEKFPALEVLTLQNNQIEELPTQLQHSLLEHLNLSKNLLKTLPDFSACPALRSFYVSENNIVNLPSPLVIPGALTEWRLGKNQLTYFPASSIDKDLHNKLDIYLQGNPLSKKCKKELEALSNQVHWE